MLRTKRGWIGIDFGTHSLRAVQMERTGDDLRLAAVAVLPRGRATVRSSVEEHCPWTGGDVQSLLSLCPSFSGRRAACMLSMQLTDLHTMTIPPGSQTEQRSMVANELASATDQDSKEREFDFWENDSAAGDSDGTGNVMVLSAPRDIVNRVAQSLTAARLSCQVMDGRPFALARAVKLMFPGGPHTPVGAVEWGHTSGTFCVVADGRPLFTRHLRNCGLGRIVEDVRQALGLAADEAAQLLITHGLPADENAPQSEGAGGARREIQEVIAEVAAGSLSEMAEELAKTVSYLKMRYTHILPERLCLLGEGAAVRNVTGLLSDTVGLPVDVWSPLQSERHRAEGLPAPIETLGTAVALSTLAWTT